MPSRRAVLATLLAASAVNEAGAATGDAASAEAPTPLRFPADFGAHPQTRIEWWYATGWLAAAERLWGFQITFFRAATGLGAASPSRFAPTQIVFAHAAVSDLAAARLRHDQRIARSGFAVADAAVGETDVALRGWRLQRVAASGQAGAAASAALAPAGSDLGRSGSHYHAVAASAAAAFAFDLRLDATQPLLLQGVAGFSQKGPRPVQSSRYYSEPQLAVRGRLELDGRAVEVAGKAWLDHEWSDSLLDAEAVGWDWIGMNLDDGAALTAFRIRRADGSTQYAGGSWRPAGGTVQNFTADAVRLTPLRLWRSAATEARYPVEWRVETPAGVFGVKALLDDQELDSRASTGSVYWEGLSRLVDAGNRAVGRGYLEMTGYQARLRL